MVQCMVKLGYRVVIIGLLLMNKRVLCEEGI